MNRIITIGDEVYLLMTPNSQIKEYRQMKCNITSIYTKGHISVDTVEFNTIDIELMKKIKVGLRPVDITDRYYTNKHLDKIYFKDELNILQQDIDNLNKILAFKTKQKQELVSYVQDNFSNWNYRSTLNI
jgi:hypothetical protein